MSDDDKPQWFVTRQTVKEVFAEGVPLTFINADTLSAWGRPVAIQSTGEFPEDALLICVPLTGALPAGRIVAACDECARPIMHMATAPPKLKRVCWVCARRLGAFDV